MRLVLVLTASLVVTAMAPAATLRVPQDYDTLQRAILAAEPGDTLVLGEGTFHENVVIEEQLTIRGAGVGKTFLTGPDRHVPVIRGRLHGPITISDLTLGHVPASPAAPDQAPSYAYTLHVASAPLVVRNVRFERAACHDIHCESNLVTFENVSVAPYSQNPIRLANTAPGSTFRRLAVGPMPAGTPIEVQYGAAVFHELDVRLDAHTAIRVAGAISNVSFPGAPDAFLDRVMWEQNARHGGIPAAQLTADDRQALANEAAIPARLQKLREQTRPRLVERRKAARELQAALENAATLDPALAALAAFLPKFYSTLPAQLDEEATAARDTVIRSELRVLFVRFGPAAVERALEKLPTREPDQSLGSNLQLPFDIVEAIALAHADTWVKANLPDLPEQLASWKSAKQTDPAAAAQAVHAVLVRLAPKLADATPQTAEIVRGHALAQLHSWSVERGPAALDHLLRLLSAQPPGFLTVEQLQVKLSPETKTALIRHWKTAK